MKLKIIVVGKTKEKYLSAGEEDFRSRIAKYTGLEWVPLRPEKITPKCDVNKIKELEGQRILQQIEKGDFVVALDGSGMEINSEQFSEFIQDKMLAGIKYLTFIIGGTLGLSDDLLQRAHIKLSLSRMTLTHEMARLILLEQIYRGFTIIKNEKYHK